ncbi:MAG: hypothetical protein J5517_04815 [Eubacterium sp.]|nr:hypothetical protein [Eubacterium sp.]
MKEVEEKNQVNFDSEIDVIAKYGEKSLEQLERHARINAGFHDYEEDSFADKQMIGNLCEQYKVFFEGDPAFKSFLDEMKEYAELDPYTHDNYVKEKDFVESIPAALNRLNEALDEQERKFQEEIRDIDEEKYNQLSDKEKEKFDRRYTMRQETIDNRRRALASFDMYFESITKGNMKDLDELKGFKYTLPQSKKDEELGLKKTVIDTDFQIEYANNSKERAVSTFYNKDGVLCYYINSAGVDMNLDLDPDGLDKFQKAMAGIANKTTYEEAVPDAPIFPHEPMMTDVSQHYSGECYLYAGLQNIARMYPQKIKDMIKDNGDGTATVRLYAKKYNEKTSKTEFNPVYVRVDKKLSKFGALGAEYERMGEDCLWVNLIERAYAMSGLHETYDKKENLPVYTSVPKYKDWKPSVKAIEGGQEDLFLENMLGPEGVSHRIDKAEYNVVKEERTKLESSLDALNTIKDMDINDPESIARHAFYKHYKIKGGKLSEKDFQKLPENKMIEAVDSLFPDTGANFENMDIVYKAIKKTAENVLEETKNMKRTQVILTNKLGLSLSNAIGSTLEQEGIKDTEADNIEKAIRKVYGEIRTGILDIGLAEEIPQREKTETFFNKVKEAIDKGLPVSCSTYGSANRMNLADERHAYSLIGAFASDDVPPKYYFRIKNPYTKFATSNGVEYVNEEGEVKGKWVNVKDGVFDMEIEDFVHDFEQVHYNGDKALSDKPAKKIVGYDIISPEQIAENEKNSVTNDKLTDYMKSANDLYDALISTNSKYSNDSQQYKDLVEGLKQFRHNLAGAQGRSIDDMKKLTQPLLKLVGDYEKHVNKRLLGPTNRQKRRKNVCTEIRNVMTAIEEGRNPHQEYEKEYAKTLINKYYDMNKIQDKSKIDEVAERMYNNKAFRGIANKTNIFNMKNPAKNQMENDLKTIETKLKGRGVDKKIDIATMQPKKNTGISK